jgi:aminoglycoside phosphotransferase (APT) family kinase protein
MSLENSEGATNDSKVAKAIEVPFEVAPVRAHEELNWAALEAYLRSNIDDLDGPFQVLQFPNGSANLTYLVSFGDRRLVLRRPPFGQLAPGSHDMAREYKALSNLWRSFDKSPRAYLLCRDHDVVGSDFFVMEYRAGVVIWGAIPESMRHYEEVGQRVGFAVIDALGELHRVDPSDCGLGDLGRPDGYVARQVSGWRQRWEAVATDENDELMTSLGVRLDQTQPRSSRSSILHNDYRLDNCQFDPSDPDHVKSIFDWDMATLGDPLMDLGTVLNYWPDPSDVGDNKPIYPEGADRLGLPTRAEVVERYALRTGHDVDGVSWYEGFACFKTAVILQQLYVRFVRGETSDERMGQRGARVAPAARRAHMILDGDVGSRS